MKQQPSADVIQQLEEEKDFVIEVNKEPVQAEATALPKKTYVELITAHVTKQSIISFKVRSTNSDPLSQLQAILDLYWLNRKRTEDELAGCIRQLPMWTKRCTIQPDELTIVQEMVSQVYIYQPVIDPLTGRIVDPTKPRWSVKTFWWMVWDLVVTHIPFLEPHSPLTWRRRWEKEAFPCRSLTVPNKTHTIDRYAEDLCTGFQPEDVKAVSLHWTAKFDWGLHPRKPCKPVRYEKLVSIKNYAPLLARNCEHNEAKAVCCRQLSTKFPELKKHQILNRWTIAFDLLKKHTTMDKELLKSDFNVWVSRYPQARKLAIIRANTSLTRQHAEVNRNTKAFVKREFIVGKTEDEFKPRLISGMSDEFLALTGPEFYAYDKIKNRQFYNKDSRIYITSGATREEVGEYHSNAINDGYIPVENDFSLFDGSQEQGCNLAYKEYLKDSFPVEEIAEYLVGDGGVTGRTSHGHKYSREGSFNSGQINTTSGNSEKNAAATLWVYTRLGYDDIKLMCIGDDSITYVRKPPDLQAIKAEFAKLGLPCSPMANELWDVEYCNMLFWELEPGVYMPGPKPGRFLAKVFHTFKHFNNDDERWAHLRGIVLGERFSAYIPMLGEVLAWIADAAGAGKTFHRANQEWQLKGTQEYTRTEHVWRQFTYRYNITKNDLEHYEFPVYQFGVVLDGLFEEIAGRDW